MGERKEGVVVATLRFLHLLALSVWIGAIVFFSFVTAPSLFGALPRDLAGRATAAIFPRYYLLGGICGLLALTTGVVLGALAGFRGLLLAELALLAVMSGLTFYAGRVILPRAARLRLDLASLQGTPDYDAAKTRFDLLHRRSVGLNGAVLLLGLGTIAIVSLRPPGAAP
ncbi:MAG TPA: DUF4149 domain-containing protein [Candidatus Polarisedimenticolia bacterium]|nr:DUF4149 domain-containing protein [Candidatus Polarisedimenticolia bacterium]